MKRSEAIRKLANFLNRTFKESFGDAEAKRVLNFIEEDLGMYPPYDASQDDEVDICEWEPE